MNEFRNDNRNSGYGSQGTGLRTIAVADANAFLSRVFSWMFAGLLLTGVVGWYVASSGLLPTLMHGPNFLIVIGVEIGLFLYLRSQINNMEPGPATAMFLTYAAMNGITFSVIFAIYSMGSILNVLLMTAVLFGVLAIFGKTTAIDLRKVGSIAFAGLFAVIIAMLANIVFIHSTGLELIIDIVCIAVFAGITAYRMQAITNYANTQYGLDDTMDARYAIISAFGLYLAFLNMFLTLLRLFGGGGRRR